MHGNYAITNYSLQWLKCMYIDLGILVAVHCNFLVVEQTEWCIHQLEHP